MPNRSAINELTMLFDHLLEENEFGRDHWHSLLWNLHNVEPDQWVQLPPGGGRTISQLVWHIGVTWLMYSARSFRGLDRSWDDDEIDGIRPGDTYASVETWLRRAHRELREDIAGLTDADLDVLRPAPWGDIYETRRIIELQLQHCMYHTGEINHIRALLQGNDDWDHRNLGRAAGERLTE